MATLNNEYYYSSSSTATISSVSAGTTAGWAVDSAASSNLWAPSISANSITWVSSAPQWSFTPDFLDSLGKALEERKDSPLDDVIKTEAWNTTNNSKKTRIQRVSRYINNGAEVRLLLKKKRVSISL